MGTMNEQLTRLYEQCAEQLHGVPVFLVAGDHAGTMLDHVWSRGFTGGHAKHRVERLLTEEEVLTWRRIYREVFLDAPHVDVRFYAWLAKPVPSLHAQR